VNKPFRVRELVARIRSALRRSQLPGQAEPVGTELVAPVLEDGDVRLDPGRREVAVRGRVVHLPRKEFELLELLMFNAGFVVTRDTIIDRVWGSDYVGDTKTLDVHVKRIRAKVEPDPTRPSRITTVRGVGYRFERTAPGNSARPPAPLAASRDQPSG